MRKVDRKNLRGGGSLNSVPATHSLCWCKQPPKVKKRARSSIVSAHLLSIRDSQTREYRTGRNAYVARVLWSRGTPWSTGLVFVSSLQRLFSTSTFSVPSEFRLAENRKFLKFRGKEILATVVETTTCMYAMILQMCKRQKCNLYVYHVFHMCIIH